MLIPKFEKLFFIGFIVLFGFRISQAGPFEISKYEQDWLDAHPEITIGLMADSPPQSMVNKDGKPEGFDAEVVALLNAPLGGRLKIVTGSWQKIYADAKAKQIDVLMCVTPTMERRSYFNFTRPYMSEEHVIVAGKRGQHFGSLALLNGHIVALEESAFLVSYLKKQYPGIQIKEYQNTLAAVRAVQQAEAQAYIGSGSTVDYLLSANGINDLDIHGHSRNSSETNVVAVRKDWPELASILDKALATIPSEISKAALKNFDKPKPLKLADPAIRLTDEEMVWVQQHPEIVVGAETDWPPFDFVVNGRAAGFANDYFRLLAEKIGLNISFVHGLSWTELIEKAKKQEIDVLPCIMETLERKAFLSFTKSYLKNPECLVVNAKDTQTNTLEDMLGKRMVCVKGYQGDKIILERYPEIKIIYVSSPLDALISVSEGRADGYIDYLGVINYLRREFSIPNLRVTRSNVLGISASMRIGVRNDWLPLIPILNKAQEAVSPEEHERLKKRWVVSEKIHTRTFSLTPAEKDWLSKLPPLRVGVDPNWIPMQFSDEEGKHKGISSAYTKIIQDKLGIDFVIVNDAWNALVKKTRAGEIDILPLVNETEERREFLAFTTPIVSLPMVIGSRIDSPYYLHMDGLNGITVGVGKGYAVHEKLNRDYPKIKTREFEQIKNALLALDSGKIDAVVANSAVFNYYKNELGLKSSLHVNNTAPYNNVLAVGVRYELSPLVPLINRALKGISPKEHELILNKWTNLPTYRITNWKAVWQVAGISLFVILLAFFWGMKLLYEVKRRRKAEDRLIEDATELKRIMEDRDRHLNLSQDLICIASMDGHFKYVSPSWEKTLGYSSEELLAKPCLDFIHPDDHRNTINQVAGLSAGKATLDFETSCLNKNGSTRRIYWVATAVLPEGVMYCTGRDVTQRRQDQARLKQFADTQTVLLREVNHRVKNNLTSIISMLHMETDQVGKTYDNQYYSNPLKKIELRILALLTIHSMLSTSKWEPIRLTDICRGIIRQSMGGFLMNGSLDLDIRDCDVFIESDTAHSLALVLSELAVNSFKYGLTTGNLAIIVLITRHKDVIDLRFSDNGPGFSDQILDGKRPDGHIGMEIIKGLVTGNMGGRIKHFNNGGACTQITFPAGANLPETEKELQ